MTSRLPGRLLTLQLAATRRLTSGHKRQKPKTIQKILVCHQLLLGDTVMLAPLFAKLRMLYPDAELVMAGPEAYVPLFAENPWGVKARSFNLRQPKTIRNLAKDGDYDLALIPGDNRFSAVAQALGSKWIVAFEGDSSWHKNIFIDEFRNWPSDSMALGDIFATLVEGTTPKAYSTDQWPTPPYKPFEIPDQPFAVFHVGASSPLKFWPSDRWRTLANTLKELGIQVVFTPGKGEIPLVNQIDPESMFKRLNLDLPQMLALLGQADLLVAPDTGISHLARITGTPSVTLFGPGSSTVFGPGKFWGHLPWQAVSKEAFPCRDQQKVFGRTLPNTSRCNRSTKECAEPLCMQEISASMVLNACKAMLNHRHLQVPK